MTAVTASFTKNGMESIPVLRHYPQASICSNGLELNREVYPHGSRIFINYVS